MTKIRSAFSERVRSSYPPAGMPEDKLVSRTQQHFGNEVNINTIVAKARKGIPLPIRNSQPLYGNFSNGVDFLAQMNRVAQVTSHFEQLPSKIRNRFSNNPAEMLDFIADPENVEESISLGLLPEEMRPAPASGALSSPEGTGGEPPIPKPSQPAGEASTE